MRAAFADQVRQIQEPLCAHRYVLRQCVQFPMQGSAGLAPQELLQPVVRAPGTLHRAGGKHITGIEVGKGERALLRIIEWIGGHIRDPGRRPDVVICIAGLNRTSAHRGASTITATDHHRCVRCQARLAGGLLSDPADDGRRRECSREDLRRYMHLFEDRVGPLSGPQVKQVRS